VFNWKNATKTFGDHVKSDGHVEVVEKLTQKQSSLPVKSQLNKQIASEQTEVYVALKAIATTLLTLAQTGSAIRGHDDDNSNSKAWISAWSEDIPQLGNFARRRKAFMSHDIQSEQLELMSNNVIRQILSDVRRSPYFGIVDETTDVSTKEQVSICVRYLHED
jgi:hypothetical protein